jgi:hypothetical protein
LLEYGTDVLTYERSWTTEIPTSAVSSTNLLCYCKVGERLILHRLWWLSILITPFVDNFRTL